MGFQSTHPRGVRLNTIRLCRFEPAISIHAPARGATTPVFFNNGALAISIHAPARGATSPRLSPCPSSLRISIHAPARGATVLNVFHVYAPLFQSTHPRGVRPEVYAAPARAERISIHAPARGATIFCVLDRTVYLISIHAPARGATSAAAFLCWRDEHFNPRTREGCDSTASIVTELSLSISIHAPARGATRLCNGHGNACRFQSTHPRGVRPLRPARLHLYGEISIHAPARGATFPPHKKNVSAKPFQSTHPRGVRRPTARSCRGR